MSTNGEKRTEIITLVDEEGNDHKFAVVDRFDVENLKYAVLVPVVGGNEEFDDYDLDDEAYIFRIDNVQGEETMVEVEDEAEWSRVAEVWEERIEFLDFSDDED